MNAFRSARSMSSEGGAAAARQPQTAAAFRTVLDMIEEQADIRPNQPAVIYGSQQLTYSQLSRRSSQMAHALRRRGVREEMLVGVCLQRSVELLTALLGIWKAGGAYVPFDPSYPVDRLAFMLADSGVCYLIADRESQAALPQHAGEVLLLDELIAGDSESDTALPAVTITPESLAYVIYTSGSTGKPKGALVCHRGLSCVIPAMQQQYGVGPGDIMLAESTIAFDAAALEFFIALTAGAGVYITPERSAADGIRLAELLDESGASVMFATPSTWRMILESGWKGKPGFCALAGGEVLPLSLAKTLTERCGGVWNVYGPTETTICVTTSRFERGVDRVTIGRPLRGVEAYILDDNLRPVPSGSAGELYIGGPAVGRGYLHRPELTRDRFLRDPFSATQNARMYKTGDVVRLLPDGNLHYLGRADNQVKIRGFRIEIEEIEATIQRFENVRAAAVRVVEVAEGDSRLWAYIVPAGELEVEKLRASLRLTLPPYMVPSEFFAIEALPLNTNRKVDRQALASLVVTPAIQRKNVEPRSPLEQVLVGIWQSIFSTEAIGVTDNFFDLGGHSLLASRMFHAVEKQCGRRISVSVLVEYPSIAELSQYMENRNAGLPDRVLVQIQSGGAKPPVFAIHGLGGSFLPFRELAAALGDEQPVYGLQLPETVETGSRRITIEDLAARYASEIQSIHPTGPVNICGHSWGGIMAFELARQMAAQGRQIGSLVLLDSDLQLMRGAPGRRVAALSCNNWRSKLNELSARSVRNGFNRRYQMLKFEFRLSLLRRAQQSPGESSMVFSREELLLMSAREYNPGIYPGRALLILANDEPGRWKAEPGLGWAEKIGGDFRVVSVPGTHLAIFEQPGLSAMAKEFKWHLQHG